MHVLKETNEQNAVDSQMNPVHAMVFQIRNVYLFGNDSLLAFDVFPLLSTSQCTLGIRILSPLEKKYMSERKCTQALFENGCTVSRTAQ